MFGLGKKKKRGAVSLSEAGFETGEISENRGFSSSGSGKGGVEQTIAPEMSAGPHARKMPKYIEAWGWAASAAKFRGLLVLLLSFILCCGSVTLLMTNSMLARKNYIVVGISSDGKPSVLEQTPGFEPGPDIFIRDFASRFFNYSNLTVDENIAASMKMSTSGFKESWNYRFGDMFFTEVRRNKIVQVTSVTKLEINTMEARQFTAHVWTVRYRSSTLTPTPTEDKVKYEIDVFKGAPTAENPWGFFVSAVRESTYQ